MRRHNVVVSRGRFQQRGVGGGDCSWVQNSPSIQWPWDPVPLSSHCTGPIALISVAFSSSELSRRYERTTDKSRCERGDQSASDRCDHASSIFKTHTERSWSLRCCLLILETINFFECCDPPLPARQEALPAGVACLHAFVVASGQALYLLSWPPVDCLSSSFYSFKRDNK